MALSSSSLENVTQLSEKNAIGNFPNETNSPSSFSTQSSKSTIEEHFIQQKSFATKSKDNSILSSPSVGDSANSSPKSLTNEEIFQKKTQTFNLSLFDSSISHSSLPSPLDTSEPLSKLLNNNKNNNTNINSSKNANIVEYGALIYDSLLTNNLTDFTYSTNLTNSMQQTQNLFKNDQQKLSNCFPVFFTSILTPKFLQRQVLMKR